MNPLLTPLHKTTCPFCFEQFHLSDAPWRPMVESNLTADIHIQRYFDLDVPPELTPVVESGNAGVKPWHKSRFVLDNSRLRDHDRVCPFCHLPLPLATATGELKSDVIAILGERWSGKSSYFGVLIHLLVTGHLARNAGFGVVAQPTWDLNTRKSVLSSTIYQERYGELFGETRKKVPPTRRLREQPHLRSPLIYRLQFFKRGPDGQMVHPARIVKATDLILFDTGGEDLEDPLTMQLTLRYLTRAAGIIFLINPLRLQGVRKQLSEETLNRLPLAEREQSTVTGDILDRFLNLFGRDPGQYGATKPIKTPVAISLMKTDMIEDLIDPGSPLLTTSSHLNGINLDDMMRVSAQSKAYLEKWAEGSISANLARFVNAGYFGVSSLGCQPLEDDTVPSFEPRRVADPLFWILHQLGYLPAMVKSSEAEVKS